MAPRAPSRRPASTRWPSARAGWRGAHTHPTSSGPSTSPIPPPPPPADPPPAPRGGATGPAPASLSRPALDGDLLAYAVAGRTGSRIRAVDLVNGRVRSLRRASRGALLT